MWPFSQSAKLPLEEEKRIVQAIKIAETKTSAEIRVHLASKIHQSPLDDAAKVFKKLKMHRTPERNGILIYIVPSKKEFCIIGDIGIHNYVKQEFWDSTRNAMLQFFQNDQISEAIVEGIGLAGAQLEKYFPIGNGNKNYLKDEISRN